MLGKKKSGETDHPWERGLCNSSKMGIAKLTASYKDVPPIVDQTLACRVHNMQDRFPPWMHVQFVPARLSPSESFCKHVMS